MTKSEKLLAVYREDPCRTLPNAFWKTASLLDGGTLDIRNNPQGRLNSIKVTVGNSCLAFWCANPVEYHMAPNEINQFEVALVHDSSLAVFSGRDFSQRTPYFRLRHQGLRKGYNCPPGFSYRDVKPEIEIETAARFIQCCYPNLNVSPEIVRGWLDHPVYAPDLWVWIIEANSGKKAALGIAEFDQEVAEASLEWIQVLPEYQKRGLGKAVVSELLSRADGRALFTTVSGELDNPTQPEHLYRKCGFVGEDVWWLLKD